MTNNIRERIKQRSEYTIQKGGDTTIKKDRSITKELRAGISLAWESIKIFFQYMLDYVHMKLRPIFNMYLNWGDIFEQDILSGESEKRSKLKKYIFELEQSIQESDNEDFKKKQNKKLKERKIELANIKDIQYISIWAYFVSFFKSFTEKTEDDLTPQEKIMKKRGNTYGNIPRPPLNLIRTMIKPVIVVGLLVVSILSNYMLQKNYINQLIDDKTQICNSIFQSKVYTEDTNVWKPIYSYFSNKNKDNAQEELLMRDYYTPCSYKTYLGCGYETIPTKDNIKKIIKSGARVLHFDVFEDVISSTGETKKGYNEVYTDAEEIKDLNKDLTAEEEYDKESYSWTTTNVSYVPMVRCATNDVSIGIPLHDIINEIKEADPFGGGLGGPLILYLDMWHQTPEILSKSKVYEGFQHSTTYDMIFDILEHFFGKSTNNDRLTVPNINGYGWGGQRTPNSSLCNIPMHMVQDKVLLISNISPQANYAGKSSKNLASNEVSTSSLSPYLYATVSYPTFPNKKLNGIEIINRSENVYKNGTAKDPGIEGFIYDENIRDISGLKGLRGSGLPELENFTKTGIMIAIPGVQKKDGKLIWKNSLQNPNFLDCFQYGIQFVFMNYQECLKETNNYIQFFVDHKQQFIVKRDSLRLITHKNPSVKVQNKELSYALKTGATIGSGPNPFFRSLY